MRIFLCLLLTVFSLPGMAWFNIGESVYTFDLGTWDEGDLEGVIPFSLQSCYGWGSCWWPYSGEDYYLRASDFGFTRDTGVVDPNLKLVSVLFSQGGNTVTDLADGNDHGSFVPGTRYPVDAELRIKVAAMALDSALPGTYSAKMNLRGWESNLISSEDSARFDVDLKIPSRVRISGLEDIALSSDGEKDIDSGYRPFCVFSQGGSVFRLRAWGEKGGFSLKGPDTASIAYEVHIRATSAPRNRRVIVPYQDYDVWNGALSRTCLDGDNMEVKAVVKQGEQSGKPTGVYTDTVTIEVEAI
ncbi:hypothetical protein GCM10023116_36580 [Kistimonas scapharcae]|uniref:Fimbrial protein n=1 Tax=Kistimonas scapharcae TaxID=1036133 RepID=A0ABP8V7H8_9GAMM